MLNFFFYNLSSACVCSSEEKIATIRDVRPENASEVRSFMGLV